jgi:hypothetical protein
MLMAMQEMREQAREKGFSILAPVGDKLRTPDSIPAAGNRCESIAGGCPWILRSSRPQF